MPRVVDRNGIREMVKMGFSQKETARRLRCSVKSVQRTIKNDTHPQPWRLGATGSLIEGEDVLREVAGRLFDGEKAAKKFGITRQAIEKNKENYVANINLSVERLQTDNTATREAEQADSFVYKEHVPGVDCAERSV